MILLEFSMSPMDKGESVSDQVSRSLKIIDESGVPYKLNPMGTVLEASSMRSWVLSNNAMKRCVQTANASPAASK